MLPMRWWRAWHEKVPCVRSARTPAEAIQFPPRQIPGLYIRTTHFFHLLQKICHAGRFDDSYHRHSAFDSSESSFFEKRTRTRKCLGAHNHAGACRFNAGTSVFYDSILQVFHRWVFFLCIPPTPYCSFPRWFYNKLILMSPTCLRHGCGQLLCWDSFYLTRRFLLKSRSNHIFLLARIRILSSITCVFNHAANAIFSCRTSNLD